MAEHPRWLNQIISNSRRTFVDTDFVSQAFGGRAPLWPAGELPGHPAGFRDEATGEEREKRKESGGEGGEEKGRHIFANSH